MTLSLVGSATPDPDDIAEAESDYISYHLATNTWNPSLHGLTAQDFPVHARLYRYLCRYYVETGELPPAQQVSSHYPAFTYNPGINPTWSSRILREDTYLRNAASHVAQLATHITNNSLTGVAETAAALAQMSPTPPTSQLIDPCDDQFYTDDVEQPVFTATSAHLNHALGGGFTEGSLTVVAARTNVGKSMWLMQQAHAAARCGKHVAYLSLEMPARQCVARLQHLVAGAKFNDYSRPQLQDLMREAYPDGGWVKFRASKAGALTPADVASFASNYDVVVVDYAALMVTNAGESHASGWNAAAEIVSGLQQAAHSTGTPVLTAAQLNRDARRPSTAAAVPGDSRSNVGKMNHTDKYASDPDFVLTLHRMSQSVTLNVMEKNRTGHIVAGWYTRFLPSLGDFHDLDPLTAKQIINDEKGEEYDD